ncbi:DUF6776 family protein [Rheinheimera marina]|uniref:DUF6776 family protein n=1 Tax=Rheinheimera marina TaxID=1774958 RepID=A0ABV9JLP6_9GAMM
MNRVQLLFWLRSHWRQLLVTLGLLGLAWWAGQMFGNYYYLQQVNLLSSRLEEMQQRSNKLTTELNERLKQNDYLTAELAVEKSASQLLQKELKSEQQKLFDNRKELAFYQRIMSPEPQDSGVLIDSFTISNGAAPGNYRFNLVLIQQDQQRKFAKGTLELTVNGRQLDKKASQDLLKLAGFGKSDKAYSFKYFQIIEGEFSLPEGFNAEKVEVQLKVAGSRNNRIEKSFFWPNNQSGEILE